MSEVATSEHEARHETRAAALELLAHRPLVVLTGAGVSTDSGIPDYRGPDRPARTPMTYQEFISGPRPQQRYWARNHLGWARMVAAKPNAGHRALAEIDPELLITQNVDGLHEAAGSRRVVALHGRVSEVICLSCRRVVSRASLQPRLDALNPGWISAHADVASNPDADVALEETDGYVAPACEVCGGVLKPDVVFFGENAPRAKVTRSFAAVDGLAGTGGALLVAGSSLTVMSGLRFVRRAGKAGVPVVIVNRGATRGDDLATYQLDAGTTEVLTELATRRHRAAGSGRAPRAQVSRPS